MISVQEARQRILASFHQLEPTFVPLGSAVDRVLVKPIYSNSDFPSFDNSSVDGFAIRAEDIVNSSPSHPITLQVIGDIPAGKITRLHISSGQAARIMTGAPLPEGANTVIMVEDTDAYPAIIGSPAPDLVSIYKSLENGENIRCIGADIKSNQEILHAGVILRPQDIGVLAMIGIEKVLVTRKPKIAIISTGDELVPLGTNLEIGKIHDSNSYMLAALAHKAGCDVIQFGIASDRYQAVEDIMTQASNAGCDLIITSAGVSAGAFDFVKTVVESSGFLNFWRVNMRPGKPLAFGSYRNTPFFGLPGNPVASFVSFIVFVKPSLELMS
ncbi:MAG: molybdopterin molybdotransferase MoeA, partial [Chloroflexi bacterium]|nr:molybdopterin molybdotransferase MoeA [Chloroflexota bacterium]